MSRPVGSQGSHAKPLHSEALPLCELRPSPHNARTHSKRQIEQIARSIMRFGFTNPILIDETNQILAGHGRAAAVRHLKLESVPVRRADYMTAAEKRAYILADNKIALNAGWDREILAVELDSLLQLDFEMELTGFDTVEIDLILEEAAEAKGEAADDVAPEYDSNFVVSRSGDLWRLGNHLLVCADARFDDTYERLLGSDQAQFVFSDPPYNVPNDGHAGGLGKVHHKNFVMASGEMTSEQHTSLLQTVFNRVNVRSCPGAIHMSCMDWRHIGEMLAAGHAVYSELKNLVVWNKSNAGMGSFYRSKHELIFVWKTGTASHINNFELGQHGRYRTNVWDYAGVNSFGEERDHLSLHPTVKPVALIADAIKDCSHRNGVVLDPFGGSGTSILAAEKTGRRARVIEIDPAYCDVAVRRWQSSTGRQAICAGSGVTFEERDILLRSQPNAGGDNGQ